MAGASKKLGLKKIKDRLLIPGDIILTTTRDVLSAAIRVATFGDISHAMVCVDDSSVIDATGEGVHARNVQRLLFDENYPVHVLRLRTPPSATQLKIIDQFLRGNIGTQYSKVAAAQSLFGGGLVSRKQFCSRLVAQAFALAGIQLVDQSDFCFPVEILRSPLLIEISDSTQLITLGEAAAWEGVEDVPQLMRDAINAVLKAARSLSDKIQTFDDIHAYLIAHPHEDTFMSEALAASGYLSVWQVEANKNPWQYQDALLNDVPESEARKYCLRLIESESDGPHRFVVNRGAYVALHALHRLHFFAALMDLYELLAEQHRTRINVATHWLNSRGLLDLENVRPVRPHSAEWFEQLEIWNPPQAAMTRQVTNLSGGLEVCSVCGDDPASDYMLVEGAPAGGPGTLRLCDFCVRHRRNSMGDLFVPFPEEIP